MAIAIFLFLSLLRPLGVQSLPDADCKTNCPPLPSCDDRSDLQPSESFPATVSAVQACGRLEQRLVRSNESTSFQNLVQYRGDDVVFVNEEHTNSWCGNESLMLCVDCRGDQPAATDERPNSGQCADRLMTGRLYVRLKLLQRFAAKEWRKRKIRVIESWDEPTSLDEAGKHPPSSLHYEGRSVQLDISLEITDDSSVPERDDDVALLWRLGALAICAGFDHVHHDSNGYLTASVKQQKSVYGTTVLYPSGATFVEVDPPEATELDYKTDEDAELLIDGDGRSDEPLSQHFKVRDVLSRHNETGQAFRYFRLDPHLLYCVESVYDKLDGGGVQIVSAYRTRADDDDKLNRLHGLGRGVEIEVVNSTTTTPLGLAIRVAEECGVDFAEKGKSFGIVLLPNSVYFDVRRSQFVSTGDRVNISKNEFEEKIREALLNAERHINVPKLLSDAVCEHGELEPSAQSPDYEYKPSKKSEPISCPEDDKETEFCASSNASRVSEVNRLWSVIALKHFLRERSDVRQALDDCLLTCSPCIRGAKWEKKVRACNEFAHWVSLSLSDRENEGNANANFYALHNEVTRAKACTSGSCFYRTESLASIGPLLLEKSFYTDESSLYGKKLYGHENNPSPLLDILHQTYAMHATGKVTLWVTSLLELAGLNKVTKALMLYNKNIAEIEIKYAMGTVSKNELLAFMRNSVTLWTTTSCPAVTRALLSPYILTPYSP